MQVVCSRRVLHRGLQAVGRAVSGRSTLPILSNVLLKATDAGFSLTATDLELWLECTLPAFKEGGKSGAVEVKESGALTVPARLLSEVIAALPEATVQMKGDEKGELVLLCAASRYEIRGLPAEEFPAFPEVGEETRFEVAEELLAELIRKTVFAASTDETRAILTGVLLLWQGKRIRMVATDSYRLSVKGADLEEKAGKEINLIIPARALHELSRFLDHSKEKAKVQVCIGPSQILFRLAGSEEPGEAPAAGELSLVSRLVEGQFPNFEKVIPKEYERRISLRREDFLATIKRCSIIAKAEANKLTLDPQGEKMWVRAESADYGRAEEEIPIALEGEGIQIAFNGEYLREALEAMSGDTVWIELTGPLSPGLLKPSDDPDHLCIVMPMQIL